MDVLNEKDSHDSELLVYTMTLINKTLSNIPDQDTFYDVTDALEEQKINVISQVILFKVTLHMLESSLQWHHYVALHCIASFVYFSCHVARVR